MFSMLRNGFVFLWVSAVLGSHGDTDSVPRTTPAPPITSTAAISISTGLLPSNSTGTCPSRTVNYITHTLARQCLRTDRVSRNSTQNGITSMTDGTGTFATTISTGDRTQVFTVTYTVSNGTSSTIAENGATVEEPASSTDSSIPSASPISEALATPTPSIEEEADSALDNANFLSFEDWKKQNLAKSGQSPEDIGRAQTNAPHRPRPVNNALDTLGDDQEIDIDFAGFGAASQPSLPERTAPATEGEQKVAASNPTSLRSRDAGKTCKERTNYASFDCAATVLKSNKEAKSATSVLIESKDSYMLNKCSADNKFFIVELCNDIQIDTVVLANYEFFSSGFRHFRLSVSDRYPVKMEKWKDLGTFEARNTREIQAFLIENPQIWARYLRIEFLTHYGTEYYCPVSLLRVHGITMMEDYRHQEELASGEDDDVTLEAEALATPPIHQEPAEMTDEASKATEQAIPPVVQVEPETTAAQANSTEETLSFSAVSSTTSIESSSTASADSSQAVVYNNGSVPMHVGVYEPTNANMTCSPPTTPDSAASSSAEQSAPSQVSSGTMQATIANSTATTSTTSSSVSVQNTSTAAIVDPSPSSSTALSHEEQTPPTVSKESNITSSIVAASSVNNTVATNQTASSTTNSTRVTASSASSPPPAQPSTQESFFKSVHKRLQQLESNSTLSLQYIEEQSRILREAFSKVEKRQVSTTSKFLAQLNETVMVELHGFRQAYDQLWQSTVIELEGQRETYQREMLALSSRLTMVADELVWQKRMGIVQSTLLLMCLALVLFGRSSNGTLEMPLMQQLLNKSTTALSGWDSPPNSPSPDSRSPVSLFRRKLWRSSTAPADTQYLSDEGGAIQSGKPVQAADPVEINIEAPSPPRQGNEHDEWTDEDRSQGASSPESARKSAPSSPGKKKRKQKRQSGGWLPGSISFAGQPARAKSPLAHGEWAE